MPESPLEALLNEEKSVTPDLSVRQFVLRTLAWVPVTFVCWYLAAALFSWPAITLSDFILPLIFPGVIEGVEQQGYLVDVVTTLDVMQNGRGGQIVLDFNALKYGYGLPLILAMMFATPYSLYDKLDNITYGLGLVILAQTWGIVFEALSILMLKTGPEVTGQVTAILPWAGNRIFLDGVALSYQLGSLILPAVVPIVFWIIRHQEFLDHLSTRRSH